MQRTQAGIQVEFRTNKIIRIQTHMNIVFKNEEIKNNINIY